MNYLDGFGAYPDLWIRDLIENKYIQNVCDVNKQTQPGSLDLSVGEKRFLLKSTFQGSSHSTIVDCVKNLIVRNVSSNEVLKAGCVYLVEINEIIDLPLGGIYAYANPKSSTGRIFVHVRLMADNISRYDSVDQGWSGKLWLLVCPLIFDVYIPSGSLLCQLRFFNKNTLLNRRELADLMQRETILSDPQNQKKLRFKDILHHHGNYSLTLSINIPEQGHCGYVAKESANPIYFDQVGTHNSREYFDEIQADENGDVTLDKDKCYILSCYESVSVPSYLTCEMTPIDDRLSELRTHYAGFIDPGWTNRPLTLEVMPYQTTRVKHRQPIARIRYEKMAALPSASYDSISSNYKDQISARLGKHFKIEE
jgi:dCTP deaminase